LVEIFNKKNQLGQLFRPQLCLIFVELQI